MTDDKVRVGLVGLGVGRSHLEAFHSLFGLFDVVAVCDVDGAKARQVADEFGVLHVYSSLDELCRRDDLDVIDLCTPSYLHFSQTLQVIEAGKHVVCEKPVAGSLREVDELIAAEKASSKRIMPIFQKRFGHGAQKLKFLVDQGVAGKAYLTTVETAWRRRSAYYSAPWRGKWQTELGGAIVTLAIHAHDVLYYILGPARSVFARMATRVNPIETEDCLSASLEMADGSLCSLSVTTGSAREITRHRFCFSHLSAESNTEPYTSTSDPWIFTGDSEEDAEQIEQTLSHFEPLPELFVGQFYRYYDALRNGTPLPITLQDARLSLELITALYASARSRQAVELPIEQDHPYFGGWQP